MKAGIIAAGEGSRLKAEGVTVPKPLVRVGGVTLIERLLRTCVLNGITEVACIVNEQSLEVKRYIEELNLSIPVRIIVKSTPSSMHSLFALSPHLSGERFLLSTVDSVYSEEEFSRYVAYGTSGTDAAGILAVTRFIDDDRPLYADLGDDRTIRKLTSDERFPWATGGLYQFSPLIFREMEPVLRLGIERLRNFLGHLISNGYRLEGYPFGKIVDVDRLSDIRAAEDFLRDNR